LADGGFDRRIEDLSDELVRAGDVCLVELSHRNHLVALEASTFPPLALGASMNERTFWPISLPSLFGRNLAAEQCCWIGR
jgi:hypothetical protein